eukprot:3940391-Rhodomonas_salina.7
MSGTCYAMSGTKLARAWYQRVSELVAKFREREELQQFVTQVCPTCPEVYRDVTGSVVLRRTDVQPLSVGCVVPAERTALAALSPRIRRMPLDNTQVRYFLRAPYAKSGTDIVDYAVSPTRLLREVRY